MKTLILDLNNLDTHELEAYLLLQKKVENENQTVKTQNQHWMPKKIDKPIPRNDDNEILPIIED